MNYIACSYCQPNYMFFIIIRKNDIEFLLRHFIKIKKSLIITTSDISSTASLKSQCFLRNVIRGPLKNGVSIYANALFDIYLTYCFSILILFQVQEENYCNSISLFYIYGLICFSLAYIMYLKHLWIDTSCFCISR